jgi:hypothetical protein
LARHRASRRHGDRPRAWAGRELKGKRRAAIAVTAAGLAAAGVALLLTGGDGDGGDERPQRSRAPAHHGLHVDRTARRVERLRGLRFDRVPRLVVVGRREMRRLARSLAPAREPAQERAERIVLTQTAMTDPESLGALDAVADEPVGLFSSEHPDRVYLHGELVRQDPREAEVTLAHELVHALEHQNVGLDQPVAGVLDDSGMAELAVVEGSATLVEAMYRIRHRGYAGPVDVVLRMTDRRDRTVPAAALYGFPYSVGSRYVLALRRRGGWRAVARARRRPPRSTAEVLGAARRGRPAASPALPRLGAPWQRLARGGFGAAAAYALLSGFGERAKAAAARRMARSIRAGSMAVWTRGRSRCALPCRDRAVAAVAVRAGSARAARTMRRRLEASLNELADVRPAGARGGPLRIEDGGAAFARRGSTLTLVFAPSASLAARLARAPARG